MTEDLKTNRYKSGHIARLTAFIIDFIIYAIIVEIIVGLLGLISSEDIDLYTEEIWTFGSLVIVLPLYYVVCLTSKFQATPGKHIMGIYVATMEGEKLKPLRALLRYFGCFGFPILFSDRYMTELVMKIYDPVARGVTTFDFYNGYINIVGALCLLLYIVKPYDLLLCTRVFGTKERDTKGEVVVKTPIYIARASAFLIDAVIYGIIVMITISAANLIFNILSKWLPAYINSDVVEVWTFISLITVLPVYYVACLTSKFQATPGKYIMGIYVATVKESKLNAIYALARYFGCFILPILFYSQYIFESVTIANPYYSEERSAMDADVINFVFVNFLFLIFYAIKPYDLLLSTRIYEGQQAKVRPIKQLSKLFPFLK